MKKTFLYLFVCLFSVVLFSFAVPAVWAASTFNYSDSTSYDLRIIGPENGAQLGALGANVQDIDNDQKSDLLVGTAVSNSYPTLFIVLGSRIEDQDYGSTLDLNIEANYDLKIIAEQSDDGKIGQVWVSDVDKNGYGDIFIGCPTLNTNGTNSGAIYLIKDSIWRQAINSSKLLDLSNSDNYSLRFDGLFGGYVDPILEPFLTPQGDLLGYDPVKTSHLSNTSFIDFDGDSQPDIVLTGSFGGTMTEGAVYIILDEVWMNYSQKNIDLSDSNNYTTRYQGYGVDDNFGRFLAVGDFDQDGTDDLLATAKGKYVLPKQPGSIYVIYNSLLRQQLSEQKSIQVDVTSNAYNYRIDGADYTQSFGESIAIGDYTSSQHLDLVAGDYNYSSVKGATYIIQGSKFNSSTVNSNFSMEDSQNYLVQYIGEENSDALSRCDIGIGDLTGDGSPDLFQTAIYTNVGASNVGSSYLTSSDQLQTYLSSTGNQISLSDISSYIFRFDGTGASNKLGYARVFTTDMNGDGSADIIENNRNINFTNTTGAVYIVYSFPHTFSIDDFASEIDNTTVTGTITNQSSRHQVSGVQFSTTNDSSNWSSCTANDGSFDSDTETFFCDLSSIKDGEYTIYFRALDSSGFQTASNGLATQELQISTTASTLSQSFSPKEYLNYFPTKFVIPFASDNDTIDHYEVTIDPHKDNSLTLPQLPASFSSDQQKATYLTNSDYQIIYNNQDQKIEVTVYSLEKNSLVEGEHKWQVKVVDTIGNSIVHTETIYIDKTVAYWQNLKINDLEITTDDSIPPSSQIWWQAEIIDPYHAQSADNQTPEKVSSGCHKIIFTLLDNQQQKMKTKTFYCQSNDLISFDLEDIRNAHKNVKLSLNIPWETTSGQTLLVEIEDLAGNKTEPISLTINKNLQNLSPISNEEQEDSSPTDKNNKKSPTDSSTPKKQQIVSDTQTFKSEVLNIFDTIKQFILSLVEKTKSLLTTIL